MKYTTVREVVDAEQFICYDKTLEELRAYCASLSVVIKGPANLVGFISFHINDPLSGLDFVVRDGDWIVKKPTYGIVAISVYSETVFKKCFERLIP